MKTRDEHLFGPGPKRILALDGGGIRGLLTLQILARIEGILRRRSGRKDLVLADYFDLIGGTSTGAIIAAALAVGYEVARLDALYRELGESIFDPSWFRQGAFRPKFPVEPLVKVLEREFGRTTLGDPKVRTGLAIVAKRLDTGRPWVVHNNPRGPYYDRRPGGTAVPNKDFFLKDVVRASTAAPTYFAPERICVASDVEGKPVDGAFVDGGVSPHNNPSLQLLMLATLEGHGIRWPLGADRLLLVSLGTGSKEPRMAADKIMSMAPALLGMRGLLSLMDDASVLNEQLLQWMSRSPTARTIDREVGDLRNDVFGGGAPWLTYLRYDAGLDGEWLKERLGLTIDPDKLASIEAMDKAGNIDTLAEIGDACALRLVEERHFDPVFDL
jgi:hypothetical protein